MNITSLGPSITKADEPYILEEMLAKIYAALPSPQGVNPNAMIDVYMIALNGLPINALRSAVYKIVLGTLDEKLVFAPRPPELAKYVRDEATWIRRMNEPKPRLPSPTGPSLLEQIRDKWADVIPIDTNVTTDDFHRDCRKGRWPAGSRLVAILGNVYLPTSEDTKDKRIAASDAVAAFKRKNALARLYEKNRADLEDMTPERLARHAEIEKLPDAKNITEDQMNYRSMALEASKEG